MFCYRVCRGPFEVPDKPNHKRFILSQSGIEDPDADVLTCECDLSAPVPTIVMFSEDIAVYHGDNIYRLVTNGQFASNNAVDPIMEVVVEG